MLCVLRATELAKFIVDVRAVSVDVFGHLRGQAISKRSK